MTMPNFLIIGAAKSGTSSLYHYLRQHPQIYMSPIKEPSFFAFEGKEPNVQGVWKRWATHNIVTDIDAYRALFQKVSNEISIGEVSLIYLVCPEALERIKRHIPNAKLLAILRNPAERTYSAYLMQQLYAGNPHEDLTQMIRRRKQRLPLDASFYYTHLKRYFNIFDRSQIRIYLYENFKTDPIRMLQDIFQFLGVDKAFVPDLSVEHMAGGIPKNRVWGVFLKLLGLARPSLKPFIPIPLRQHSVNFISKLQRRGLVKPPLEPAAREELLQIYQEDILKLQDLIQRDLSAWLEA